jgi:phosphoglycerate dehydrogenase-like enzyme
MTTIWLKLDLPEWAVDHVRNSFPGVTCHTGDELQGQALAGVNAVFLSGPIADGVVERMPQLQWLHSTYGGAETMMTRAVTARKLTLTTSKGTHSVPFTEFTIAAIFAMAKHIPRAVHAQSERRWDLHMPDGIEVAGTTLGIVGFGAIGSELARVAHPLGMRVIATRLTPESKPAYVDWIKTPEALPELLAESDFVVLAVPGAPDLAGIINEQALRSMKPTAVLINLTARNAVPDEEIVARALREGWIGGAVFNVFNTKRGEIADDSPLWDAPNMLVSPRIPALDPRKWERVTDLFAENLRRFIAGQELINVAEYGKSY